MEQGILIVHMPKRCADCKLNCSIGGEQPFCYVNLENVTDDEYYHQKPEWCPLSPVPKRKNLSSSLPEYDNDTHYEQGYNACIDDILKRL